MSSIPIALHRPRAADRRQDSADVTPGARPPARCSMNETQLIDINELSKRLSIPKGTIYNWVSQHRIPFIKAGRSLRFDVREVIQSLRHCPILDMAGQR